MLTKKEKGPFKNIRRLLPLSVLVRQGKTKSRPYKIIFRIFRQKPGAGGFSGSLGKRTLFLQSLAVGFLLNSPEISGVFSMDSTNPEIIAG